MYGIAGRAHKTFTRIINWYLQDDRGRAFGTESHEKKE